MQALRFLKKITSTSFSRRYAKPVFWMLFMSAFAFVVTHRIVLNVIKTGPPRAWDGTGHFAVAQIYDNSIFPDTFGWVDSYFAGMPFPNPAAMFATLDPSELERKIGELRIVEGWLQMSLNMMQLSIKTMELQKASLEALRGSQAPGQGAPPAAGRKS